MHIEIYDDVYTVGQPVRRSGSYKFLKPKGMTARHLSFGMQSKLQQHISHEHEQ
jgi:hypothetical protein